ncbi:MAG: tryptophan--tRNA ligase [Clostridia bacterium]|nr:tryptophan--tRNA ligase [Clostridia bacterium]
MTENKKPVFVTGDRPTGRLHLGHLVGSLRTRVVMQDSGKYESFIFIADMQALTDNAKNPEKIQDSILQVALDYLSVGVDPNKSTVFIQSQVPQLSELTMIYMNLVTLSRLQRNPTVKKEIEDKGFKQSIPVGFLCYPISQTADTTAFNANLIPAGEDQNPITEQGREIVRSFNAIYGDVLVESNNVLPDRKAALRLPGIDGKAKMSKSMNNCIYLSDTTEEVRAKVMSMFTDPNHIKIEMPGDTEKNPVFIYLRALATDDDIQQFEPEFGTLENLEARYRKGGVGDVRIKKLLFNVIEKILTPIREKRKYYEEHIDEVIDILEKGCEKARAVAQETVTKVRKAMGIEYFQDDALRKYSLRMKKTNQ